MDTKNFTWIPFYTELAEKLLEYKDKREELVEFIFSEDGLREFSDYLHLEDKEQKIDDIDPFSFMGMFNRGKLKKNNRISIANHIKDFLGLISDVPKDFDGIPVLNYKRMFFYHWHNLKDSCDRTWSAFEQMMNGNISPWFEYYKFQTRKAECTMPLFWCKAEEYIALDSRNRDYLESIGVSVNVSDVDSYMALLQDLKNKMESGQLKEKSFPELSYNAWNMSKENISFWSGGIKWEGGKTSMIDEFNSQKHWQIGWKKDDKAKGAKQAWDNIKKVRVGDYLAFHGYGGKNDLTIYQISKVTEVDENNGRIYFDRLSQEDDELYHGKAPKMSKGSWFGTLFPVKGEEAIEKIFGNFLKQETNIMNSEIQRYTDILRLKKNIILQGAPGTGKTYNTAALALSICGESVPESHDEVMQHYDELLKEGRIGFCTFHQSMDYEDFVEGMKPIKPDEGEMYYKVEDGIFKIMCANAEKGNAIRIDNFKESWDKLVNYLDENDFLSVDLLSGKGSFNVELNEYGTGLANRTYENGVFEKDKWIQGKSKFFNYDQLYNIYRGLSGTPAGGHDNYRKAIVAKMKKDFALADFSETAGTSISQNYVLIIDEINRGNVSRIFGELITLLEKDKRLGGEHPIKVTLPYSKESFGVPENLYIIGTMNTTDRSVGNIDYAVRRRFAFATLQSQRDLVVTHSTEKAAVLFDAVKSFIEKNKTEMDFEDLMVGHSYFFAKDDEELALRWQYEILPLLNEYIKDDIIRANRIETNVTVDAFIESSNPIA
ncbi:MAG: hypothetical protein E7069_11750 [Bacteroidales bacterium]|jgi:hypothetical protein|nr:hypothetical protein [Bacteroidales bacterium]